MTLKEAFIKCSQKVWAEMRPAPEPFRIKQIREDGISSLMLKYLADLNCSSVEHIIESDKHGSNSEKELGYDFDVWIGTKTEKVRYIIQAKSLRNKFTIDSKYYIKGSQVFAIEAYAQRDPKTAIPLYAFYQHLTDPEDEIQKYYNSEDDYQDGCMGVTITSTNKIKKYSEISFKDLHCFQIKTASWFPLFDKHPEDIRYYQGILNSTVPFHELSSVTISKVKAINRTYRKLKERELLRFFFFGFPLNFGDNLIPVHKITSEQIVESYFTVHEVDGRKIYKPRGKDFKGRFLIILKTDE